MRIFISTFFIVFAFTCFGNTPSTFRGKFGTKKLAGKKIHISSFYGTTLIPLDTVMVSRKGSFTFTLILPNHPGYYRIAINENNYTDVILKKGEDPCLVFEGDELKKWKSVTHSTENKAVLTGQIIGKKNSSKTKLFHELDSLCKQVYPTTFFRQTTQAYIPMETILPDTFPSEQKRFLYLMSHYFDAVDFSNDALVYSTLLPNVYMRYFEKYTLYDEEGFKKSVDYILSCALKNDKIYAFSLDFLIQLFKRVGPEIVLQHIVEQHYLTLGCGNTLELSQNSASVINTYDALMPGKTVPDLLLPPLQNTTDSLRILNICANNKLTCVVFWSSYCQYCALKASLWTNLYQKFHTKGLQMVFVSLDTDEKEWQNGITDKKLNGLHIYDGLGWKSKTVNTLHVNRTPYLYLLNNKGEIVLKDPLDEQLENYIVNFFR